MINNTHERTVLAPDAAPPSNLSRGGPPPEFHRRGRRTSSHPVRRLGADPGTGDRAGHAALRTDREKSASHGCRAPPGSVRGAGGRAGCGRCPRTLPRIGSMAPVWSESAPALRSAPTTCPRCSPNSRCVIRGSRSPSSSRTRRTSKSVLLTNEFDLGFIGTAGVSRDIVSEPFLEDELFFCCAPGHPLAHARSIAPERLAKERIVIREAGFGHAGDHGGPPESARASLSRTSWSSVPWRRSSRS